MSPPADEKYHLTGNNGLTPDESDSVYSFYALDTIAINDDSDTEYFDAQGQNLTVYSSYPHL